MYDGGVNVDKLDNWIHQIEVYCRIQRIKDDKTKIHHASLRLEGETLIWWEAKTQEDMKKHGRLLSSCCCNKKIVLSISIHAEIYYGLEKL